MGFPLGNRRDTEDLLVLGKTSDIARIQLFALETFDEASALAFLPRPENVQRSIDQFGELRASGGLADLRSEATRDALREIVRRTPNHLSAELLLRSSLGRAPAKLSLAGSFKALDRTTAPFLDAILSKRPEQIAKSDFGGAMIELQRIPQKLDPRTGPLHQATHDLFVYIRRHIDKQFGNRTQYDAYIAELGTLVARFKEERDAIMANKEIQEELAR